MSGTRESSEERFARHVVSHFTGSQSEPADKPGAPAGTVDAWLHYSSGRLGALETTWASDGTEFKLRKMLERYGHIHDAPGKWAWSVQVASPKEFRRVASIADHVMLTMEHHNATQLWDLPPQLISTDQDLIWARDKAESLISPHPEASSALAGEPKVLWYPLIRTAFLGTPGEALTDGIGRELASKNIVKHVQKLLRHEADERHLFVLASESGLTEAANFALLDVHSLPSAEPELPMGITDLWVHSGFGQRMLRWHRGSGWMLLIVPVG